MSKYPRIRVYVKNKHIAKNTDRSANASRANTCPIALALRERGFTGAKVGWRFGSFYASDGTRILIDFSPKVSAFIRAADSRVAKLNPFSFLIEVR